jgi:hypothetical protein
VMATALVVELVLITKDKKMKKEALVKTAW